MINLNFCNYYLRLKITRDRVNRIIRFDQFDYFNFVFDRHEMTNCKFQATLINVNLHLKLVFEKHETFVKFKTKYQFVVDFLMYIMLKTRLDIVYAIFVINRFFQFNENSYDCCQAYFSLLEANNQLRIRVSWKFSNAFELLELELRRRQNHSSLNFKLRFQYRKRRFEFFNLNVNKLSFSLVVRSSTKINARSRKNFFLKKVHWSIENERRRI